MPRRPSLNDLPDLLRTGEKVIDGVTHFIDVIGNGIDKLGGAIDRNMSEAPLPPTSPETKPRSNEGVACIPCTEDHLSTVSSDLNEATRLARDKGVNDPEVLDRLIHARDELNAWERWDASPDKLFFLAGEERNLMEATIPQMRKIRRALDSIRDVSSLEALTANSTQLRQWFAHQRAKLKECDSCERAESLRQFMEQRKAGMPESNPSNPGPKEPWQMTKAEFAKAFQISRINVGTSYEGVVVFGGKEGKIGWQYEKSILGRGTDEEVLQEAQKRYVQQALSEGKPVPPEVLKDYPDLQKKLPGGNPGHNPEPWQMTLEEYAYAEAKKYGHGPPRMDWVKAGYGEAYRGHKSAVQRALSEGKPVPAKVLKDYPDLAAKALPTTEAAAPEVISQYDLSRTARKFDIQDIRQEGTLARYDLQAQQEWLGKGTRYAVSVPKDRKLTIYRATPTGEEISAGDYVTTSRLYAEEHIRSNLGGKGKITSIQGTLDDLAPADAPNEFWYVPEVALPTAKAAEIVDIIPSVEKQFPAITIRESSERTVRESSAIFVEGKADEIIIGTANNPTVLEKNIALLHELGHIKGKSIPREPKLLYPFEKEAGSWIWAIENAPKYGITKSQIVDQIEATVRASGGKRRLLEIIEERFPGIGPRPMAAVPGEALPAAEAVAKEAWQMTREEFISANPDLVSQVKGRWGILHYELKTRTGDYQKVGQIISDSVQGVLEQTHSRLINKALSESKPVPAEVLKDYPDLAAKYPQSYKPQANPLRERTYRPPSPLYVDMGIPVYFDEGGYKVYLNIRWANDPKSYQVTEKGYGRVESFATVEEAIADARGRIKSPTPKTKYPDISYHTETQKPETSPQYGPLRYARKPLPEEIELWYRVLREVEAKYPIGHPTLANDAERAKVSQQETRLMIAHEIYIERRSELGARWVKEKVGGLTSAEVEYLNKKAGSRVFEVGRTIEDIRIERGSDPGFTRGWEDELKGMPGRPVSRIDKISDEIDELDDRITAAEDAGRDTAKLEARKAKLESELFDLEMAEPGAAAQQPWQMTRAEFVGQGLDETGPFPKENHHVQVKRALAEGKPVPAEVLKDYPDLVKALPTAEAGVPTEIFIRGLKQSERANPSSIKNMAKIPDLEGYAKVYKPYGEKGRGYYYKAKPQALPTAEKGKR